MKILYFLRTLRAEFLPAPLKRTVYKDFCFVPAAEIGISFREKKSTSFVYSAGLTSANLISTNIKSCV